MEFEPGPKKAESWLQATDDKGRKLLRGYADSLTKKTGDYDLEYDTPIHWRRMSLADLKKILLIARAKPMKMISKCSARFAEQILAASHLAVELTAM